MNNPIVQANENLVTNGDFVDAFRGWTKDGQVGLGTAE